MSKAPPAKLAGIMVVGKGEAVVPEPLPDASLAAPLRVPEPLMGEARDAVTIRMLRDVNRRIAIAASSERRTKQSLIDQALAEFLTRIGY